jgi:hypothetical protein
VVCACVALPLYLYISICRFSGGGCCPDSTTAKKLKQSKPTTSETKDTASEPTPKKRQTQLVKDEVIICCVKVWWRTMGTGSWSHCTHRCLCDTGVLLQPQFCPQNHTLNSTAVTPNLPNTVQSVCWHFLFPHQAAAVVTDPSAFLAERVWEPFGWRPMLMEIFALWFFDTVN